MNRAHITTLPLKRSGDSCWTKLPSVQATESLGYLIGRQCTGGEVLTLVGELGAGKTVFVRGLALGIEIDPKLVTSPTFTLIHEYRGRHRLIHADLYRIETQNELTGIGFYDYFESSTIMAIEWAERMGDELATDRLHIHLEHQQQSVRKATLSSTGPRSSKLLAMLCKSGSF